MPTKRLAGFVAPPIIWYDPAKKRVRLLHLSKETIDSLVFMIATKHHQPPHEIIKFCTGMIKI